MSGEKNYYIELDKKLEKTKQFIEVANADIIKFEKQLQEVKAKRKESENKDEVSRVEKND